MKRGGWYTGLRLRETIIENVFRGPKVTNQAAAQSEIVLQISVKKFGQLKGTVYNDIQTCIISKQAYRTSKVFDYIINVNEK